MPAPKDLDPPAARSLADALASEQELLAHLDKLKRQDAAKDRV